MCAHPSDSPHSGNQLDMTTIHYLKNKSNIKCLTSLLTKLIVQFFTACKFICVILCNDVHYQLTHQGTAEYRDQRREEVVHLDDTEMEAQKPEGTTHGFPNLVRKFAKCNCQSYEADHISYLFLPGFKQNPILLAT